MYEKTFEFKLAGFVTIFPDPFLMVKVTQSLTSKGESDLMLLCHGQNRRAVQKNMVYIDDQRVMMKYLFPLNEIVVDFYDLLKSMSSGYAR